MFVFYLLFTNIVLLFEKLQEIRKQKKKKEAREILLVDIFFFGMIDFNALVLDIFVIFIIICLISSM